MAKNKPLGKANVVQGSYIVTQHTERNMKLYGVYEGELHALTLFNSITMLFASLGTGLISFGASQFMDSARETSGSGQDWIARVPWFCLIGGTICYFIAAIAYRYRGSALTTIIGESRPITRR